MTIPSASRIHVNLPQNGYDIHIGQDIYKAAADDLANLLAGRQVVIITDENVGREYLVKTEYPFGKPAREFRHLTYPAGEASKSFKTYEQLVNDILVSDILGLSIDRQTVLVALGGGVIGDLVGFAAASLLRGLDYIQIPTSLLAQVDSSVGGKTGINTNAGKNLVGAFHQPRLVLIDTDFLTTLPERELKAGYAEIVKYGLLGDPEFYDWLEKHGHAVIGGDPVAQAEAIRRSCQAKADIVAADEKESGKRALLNLGHTFAHAFEAVAGYDGRLLHGEAVSVGLVCAFEFSQKLGLCPGQDVERVKNHLQQLGLPTSRKALPAGQADPKVVRLAMQKDKKNQQGRLTMILVRGIGDAFVERDINEEELFKFLVGPL